VRWRGRVGALSVIRKWGDLLAPCCAALIVLAPAFDSGGGVPPDLVNHIWLVRVQAQAFHASAWPTYFVNSSGTGVFFPVFLFYGGTLYAAVGALAAIIGHARAAFFISTALAVIAAYGGLLWLSRQLGARSWRAHAPSIAFVASAYYITNLWGRGDWPELMATSMVPLLVASAWRLARAPRIEPLPAFLLVVATVFFAGSHNVSLVLGTLVLVGLLVVLGTALGRDLVPCGQSRLAAPGGLPVLGVAINTRFLLPDLLHASQTRIASGPLTPATQTGFLNTPDVLFNPLRFLPAQSTTPALYVQTPDWFLFWVIVASAVLWSFAGRAMRRVTVALVALLAVLLALIMIGPLWDAMPTFLREVQFPYRVNTYVALCVSGLVMVWVLVLERASSESRGAALSVSLVSATAISVLLAVWQVWYRPVDPTFYYNLKTANLPTSQVPPSFPPTLDYADSSEHVVVTAPTANLEINPAQVSVNHATVTVSPPPGKGPFATNITAGPYAAHIGGGVARLGRTPDGASVVWRTSGFRGPVTMSVSPAGGSLTLGRIVSLVAFVTLLIVMIRLSGRRLWARRRVRSNNSVTRSRSLIYAAAGDDRPSDHDHTPPS
jgi:hypothetical protein